jgi:predicted hotdog family 3-hydroxylacyl-ACP dehydratase
MSSPGLPDIEALIPHRGAMRLIDRVIELGENRVVALATVPASGPFVSAAADPPGYIALEMMAQSVSAWDGWRRRERGGAPEIGFLLGTRRFRCDRVTLVPGATVRIAARMVFCDDEMACFECEAWDGAAEPFAQAMLNVFCPATPTDPQASP